MQTGALVAALTGAGIVGGIAGALVAQATGDAPARGPVAAVEPAPDLSGMDESVARELTALRARLDEMQASVAAASAETARLQADVVKEREAAGVANKKLDDLLAANAAVAAGTRPLRPFEGDAIRFETLGGHLKMTSELRALPEDERWTKAREALGLSGGQEEELKAAIKERSEAMRAAVVVDNRGESASAGTGSGETISVRMPDVEKMREARKKYDDRVAATLTPEQSKKWREEGYEAALGVRGAMFASTVVVEGDR